MSKLLMLSGLPASGKSTRAAEIVAQGNWVRVNRDLLREMLHFGKWSGKNESEIVRVETSIVAGFLSGGNNVVVDDTNLNPKNKEMWKNLAREYKATFETELVGGDLPIEELVMRDGKRDKSVGGTVIKNMALQYGLQPAPSKGYVICDIDGTIANCEHRRHFVQKTPKDWKGFFAHMGEDTLIQSTAHLLIDYYNKMHTIIFVSARPEDYKEQTLDWLEKHNMTFAWTLIMRPKGDTRPDTEVKQDIYDKYLKKYPIEVVIDDRPVVIEMWKSHGLKVIDVGNGEDF